MEASPLAAPMMNDPFIIETDASKDGMGAVLKQVKNGKEVIIRFASRKFKQAERNYSVIEKEMLAIVFAVEVFAIYLFNEFTVRSDHRPLSGMLSMKNP